MPDGEVLDAVEEVAGIMTRELALLNLGSYLIIGMAAPFLFLFGANLLKPKEEKLSNRAILGAALCSGAMLVLGIIMMGVAILLEPDLMWLDV